MIDVPTVVGANLIRLVNIVDKEKLLSFNVKMAI